MNVKTHNSAYFFVFIGRQPTPKYNIEISLIE